MGILLTGGVKVTIGILLIVGLACFTLAFMAGCHSDNQKQDDEEQIAYLKEWSEKHKRQMNQ